MARRKNYRRRTARTYHSVPKTASLLDAKFSVNDIAKTALAGVRAIKDLINVELFNYSQSSAFNQSTTPITLSLASLPQGDADGNRTGNSILVKDYEMRLKITKHPSAINTYIRHIIVRDLQQIADTVPVLTDVLQTGAYNDFYTDVNKGRFQILNDRTYELDTNNVGQSVSIRKKLQKHVKYNGSTGTDIQKGGIYSFWVSNEATNTPTITWQSRLRYYDN